MPERLPGDAWADGVRTARRRGWPARLAVAALVLQALLPFAHRAPAEPGAPPAWVLASLCRSPASVAPPAEGWAGRRPAPPFGNAPWCPICAALQITVPLPPGDAVAVPPPPAAGPMRASPSRPRPGGIVLARIPGARAPPASA